MLQAFPMHAQSSAVNVHAFVNSVSSAWYHTAGYSQPLPASIKRYLIEPDGTGKARGQCGAMIPTISLPLWTSASLYIAHQAQHAEGIRNTGVTDPQ